MKILFQLIAVLIGGTLDSAHAQIDCTIPSLSHQVKVSGGNLINTTAPGPIRSPLLNGPDSGNNDRLVWWVHGLGGNNSAWQDAVFATTWGVPGFPARQSLNLALDYSNFMSSIGSSAAYLNNIMKAQTTHLSTEDHNQGIWLAHSMGGLVGRFLDEKYDLLENQTDRRFGGIVTFGTPHQGASIINNAVPDQNGNAMVLDFFEQSCKDLAIGPAKENAYIAGGTSFIIRLVLNRINIDTIVDGFCGVVKPIVPTLFQDFNQQITQDFKSGGVVVDSLNQDTSSIPKIAFYGEEEDETMFWRTMHYLMNNPNDDEYFDAIHDSIAVNWAKDNMMKYYAKYFGWKKLWGYYQYTNNNPCLVPAWNCDPCNYYNLPPSCNTVTKPQAKEIYEGFKRGYDWWINANDGYRAIIGAVELDTTTVQECWCRDCASWEYTGACAYWHDWYPHDLNDCTNIVDPGLYGQEWRQCEQRPTTYIIKNFKKADGVVLAESASRFPNGDGTYAVAERMDKSSHQQMRNDDQTKEKLNKTFGGLIVPWFFIPEK